MSRDGQPSADSMRRPTAPDPERQAKRIEKGREYGDRPEVRERQEQYNAACREIILAQKREAERKRTARIAARDAANAKKRERYRANPEAAKARVRAWARANPERVKQIKAASRERNREERNARERARYAAEAESRRVRQREYRSQAENRDRIAAQKRESERRRRDADREAYNAYQRGYRAREKRRHELGLPPRPERRSTRNEIAANETAAFEFFTKRRGDASRRSLAGELIAVHRATMLAGAEQSPEGIMRDVARLGEVAAARARFEADRFAAFINGRAGEDLREEVLMDNTARRLTGKDPMPDVDAEVQRRAEAFMAAMARKREGAERTLKDDELLDWRRVEYFCRAEAQARQAASGPVVLPSQRAGFATPDHQPGSRGPSS